MLLLGAVAVLAPSASAARSLTAPPPPTPPSPLRIEGPPQTQGPLDLAAVVVAQVHGLLSLKIVTRGDWKVVELTPPRRRRLCLTVVGAAGRATACVVEDNGRVALRTAGHLVAVTARRTNPRTLDLAVDPARLGLASGPFTLQVSSAWTDAAGCPPAAACHAQLPVQAPAAFHLVADPVVGCTRSGPALAFNGARSKRVVALTFDDGPWPDTPGFVAVLEREHVPATFFMIGDQVAGQDRLLARELADGDALGNHSFTHPFLTRTGDAQTQLSRTTAAIERTTGYRPCVFRPPYGDRNGAVIATALGQSMSTVVWDVDPKDFTRPGSGVIAARVLGAVSNGSIVLMHDGGGPRAETLAALPRIIDTLRSRGYRFVTVPVMLGYSTRYA